MNEQKKTMTQETQNREDFIMLPTVDFCFKELMQNAKVRQGMIAARSYIQNIRMINMGFWM